MPIDTGYTTFIDNAKQEPHWGALLLASFAAVNKAWSDEQVHPGVKGWLIVNANTEQKVTDSIREYLPFIVTHPDLIVHEGQLALAELADIRDVILALLTAFVNASIAAKQAGM